jgi:hypothetical protein
VVVVVEPTKLVVLQEDLECLADLVVELVHIQELLEDLHPKKLEHLLQYLILVQMVEIMVPLVQDILELVEVELDLVDKEVLLQTPAVLVEPVVLEDKHHLHL